jgi:AcrR family transcriptional regulator
MTTKTAAKPSRGGPGRLSAEDAAALPGRLLDAARALFETKGFGDTSMEEIAKRAGASTKTLYARHADKKAILQAVADRMIERHMQIHLSSPAGDPATTDPRSFLTGLGQVALAGINGEGAGLIRMALSEARRIPGLGKMYCETIGRAQAVIVRALTIWRDQGLMPALGDPDKMAGLWLTLLTDGARIRVALGDPMSKAECAEHIALAADLFLRGVGYTPSLEQGARRR